MAKIVLIEDEDLIRDLYKMQLDKAGLLTDAFATGKEGLEAIKNNPYNLLLLDIMLPDTNGLEILRELKSDSGTQSLPVILLTNLGQEAIIKEGFQLGAEGYLIKASYTPQQIIQEVQNLLQKKAPSAAV